MVAADNSSRNSSNAERAASKSDSQSPPNIARTERVVTIAYRRFNEKPVFVLCENVAGETVRDQLKQRKHGLEVTIVLQDDRHIGVIKLVNQNESSASSETIEDVGNLKVKFSKHVDAWCVSGTMPAPGSGHKGTDITKWLMDTGKRFHRPNLSEKELAAQPFKEQRLPATAEVKDARFRSRVQSNEQVRSAIASRGELEAYDSKIMNPALDKSLHTKLKKFEKSAKRGTPRYMQIAATMGMLAETKVKKVSKGSETPYADAVRLFLRLEKGEESLLRQFISELSRKKVMFKKPHPLQKFAKKVLSETSFLSFLEEVNPIEKSS